ncbi:response regulator [Caenimonas terrae]|uniref:Response regulator n=1 Tax=Caenimonas terrae TaxID=696074 RepID=A0ABW0NIU3_9BURK
MKVLLVEDSMEIQKQIGGILEAIPGTRLVEVFATGAQAGEWLERHPAGWDLAVVDLFLREGHGFDVLRRCRRRKPHQKAVVLSNYSRAPVADFARQAGADAFFDKSLGLEQFVQFCVSQSAACQAMSNTQ